jgi:hypothetical protein
MAGEPPRMAGELVAVADATFIRASVSQPSAQGYGGSGGVVVPSQHSKSVVKAR